MASIAAVRLEVLPDPSLPQGGSGRHFDSGNFHLTTFRAWVARDTDDEELTGVPIRCVSADFSQSHLPVWGAIDDNDATPWGVAYLTGQPQPIQTPAPTVWTSVENLG